MEQRGNRRRRNYNGRIALYSVMIGFCILALIEIIYGQKRLKLEKERLALEETNYQTLQALEQSQEDAKAQSNAPENTGAEDDKAFMNTVEKTTQGEASQTAEAAQGTETGEGAAEAQEDPYDMQIVFLGDSILDNVREYDGIATLIGDACNAKVYNMSMGGTTAALVGSEQYDFSKWESRCLLGVVNAILGNIDGSIFEGYRAGEILKECDFSKTDYFVIEYGINDFLAQVPQSIYLENGEVRNIDEAHTYVGALDTAVTLLHSGFPDAKIMLIAPHFCQFYNGETFVGDGYTLDYGYGKLIDYARVCGYVAEQHKEEGTIFYNAIEEGGINVYNADQCLEDGIHLTSLGRQKYVEYAIRLIKADFYREE